MKFFGKSDVGLMRKVNEDSWVICENKDHNLILAVADGMGGHNAGDIASAITIKQIEAAFKETDAKTSYRDFLKETMKEINKEIYEQSIVDTEKIGMGTTIVAAIIDYHDNKIIIGNVGDSRAYLINQKEIIQITTDHSMVQELVDEKMITLEEAKTSPIKNVITSSLGIKKDFKLEIVNFPIEGKFTLLLCSDGVSDLLDDEKIHNIFKQNQPINYKINEIIEQAKKAGGFDNITAVAHQFGENK